MSLVPDQDNIANAGAAGTGAPVGGRIMSRGAGRREYVCRMAAGEEDLRQAQTLRFLVFNLELNEGLAQSYTIGRDVDPFDAVCDHLVVEDVRIHQIVGTYRLQSGLQASRHLGYYSAQEFDLAPLEPLRGQIVELGRACVHIEHRNLVVLGLLWKGIAEYARERQVRYLIGCSSLSSVDPAVGARAYADMKARFLAPPKLQVQPLPACACPLTTLAPDPVKTPRLLSAYLSVGAHICGPPAIDREFKTIDFLTLQDLDVVPEKVLRRYTQITEAPG